MLGMMATEIVEAETSLERKKIEVQEKQLSLPCQH